jgi:predicted 2-oxoglutarate/Fe(II)-dependent dioxygenase YbiX
MIIEFDDYVDRETLEFIHNSIDSRIATYGEVNDYHRAGVTVSVGKVTELQTVNQKLTEIFKRAKRDIRQYYKNSYIGTGDTGYEFHRYYPGDICKEHSDSEIVAGIPTLRYASAVLHLNTVAEGGELVFPAQEKTVKTQAGKMVIFPPYGMFSHYTTPAKVVRDVIVTWFIYDGLSVVKNSINTTKKNRKKIKKYQNKKK